MSSIDAILLAFLTIAAPVITIVAVIQVTAALRRPRIQFLTTTATLTSLIALLIVAYVIFVGNGLLGQPLNSSVMRTVFRVALVGLAAYPIWWAWLYRTGRFDDHRGSE